MRIGLVGCVKSKRVVPAKAADIYVSALFRGRRAYVEETCDRWFILSAKHGLVLPNQTLQPYDLAMSSLSVQQRRAWSADVIRDLHRQIPNMRAVTFEIHVGAPYRDYGLVNAIDGAGGRVENPTLGMSQGRQLQFYAQRGGTESRRASPPSAEAPVQQPGGATLWPIVPASPKRRLFRSGIWKRRGRAT